MQVRFSHNIEKSLHSVSKKKLYSLHCRSRDCKLFAARDIAEWERQMAEMQPERQMRIAARPTGATVRCPKCRARNFKVTEVVCSLSVGNNWIWVAELMWRWEVYISSLHRKTRGISSAGLAGTATALYADGRSTAGSQGTTGHRNAWGLIISSICIHLLSPWIFSLDLPKLWMWRSVYPASKT